MTWLTWRQLRTQATAVYVAVAAAAVVLLLTGPRLARLPRLDVFDRLTGTDRTLYLAGVVVLALAPAVIGAFWGAPLVARELEAGTHRLAWSQSVTRTRWLATKLAVTTLAAAAGTGLLTLAVSRWAIPLDGAVSRTRGGLPSRLTPVTFAMRGIVPIGYAVFALVLGVLVGLVLRRTLPAMAVTLVIYVVVQVAMPLWVRPHLVPPVHTVRTISTATIDSVRAGGDGQVAAITLSTGHRGDWVLSNQTVDSRGRAALPSWLNGCIPPPPTVATEGPAQAPDLDACFSRLTAEGYRQQIVYQPADRFWPLQWAETGLFLVLSAGLAGLSFWVLRRH